MSITEESICNDALLSLGQETITSLSDTNDPQAVKLNSIFDARVEFLLGAHIDQKNNGWTFARTRKELTRVHQLTVDTAPTPSSFAVGATLTGATSGATCTVKKVVSSTVYWVTEPSADFSDGEILSDGTNSVNCATDYPDDDDTPLAFGSWSYGYAVPDDYLANLALVDETSDTVQYPYHREGNFIFANVSEAYAKYTMALTDVTTMPGWFTNLLAMDLAKLLAPKFVGKDPYIALRAEKNLAEAWMDALARNGGDTYWESAGAESQGNTDVYEGYRFSDY